MSGESQFPAIWSEEGKYLASVLGDALVKGLTQVSQERPEDPVEYLANFLRKYGKDGPRPDSPAFEEDAIAQAAAAATVTSLALHNGLPSEALPEVEEQTEEPTSDEPIDTSDEPPEEQTSDEQGETTMETADDEATQAEEEQVGEETETQGKVETEENEVVTVDATEEEAGNPEEPMEEDGEGENAQQEAADDDGETVGEIEPKVEDDSTNETDQAVPDTTDSEDAEMLKRLETEVEEQNEDEEHEDVDAIESQEDPEEEIEGAGQRDERGQSVLHFAAARPGGSQTLLAFLHNPTVNLAWRDERMKTARDVASSLNRSENLQTIDSYVVGKAMSGDLETLQKLLLDGYDHLDGIEDTNKNNIIELAGKAGQENVANFLKSVPQFQEKLDKLMDSIRLGDLDRVKEFLKDVPDLAVAVGKHGRTPLHVAVLCEEYSIVQYIAQNFPQALRKGDNMERTALHYAMGIEKVEKMTRILVRMGAKRVLKDVRGRQPSYYFINREEIAILQEEEKST